MDSTMTLEQFHSLCIKYTLGYFDDNQRLETTVFALKPDGDVIVLFRGYDNNDEKQYTYNIYALILAAEQALMYCLASEAWWYKDESMDVKNAIPPSEHPDKQEAIITVATDRNNHTISELFKMEKGKILSNAPMGEQTVDQIKLFDRIPKDHGTDLSMLAKIPKPDWYKLVPKNVFLNNVRMDA